MERSIVALPAALVAACVSASVHQLDQGIRPPRAPEAVEVLHVAPERPHTVVARIEARTDAVFHDVEDLRRKLIVEAARIGGDALVLGRETACRQPILFATGVILCNGTVLEADVIVFARADGPQG